MNVIKVIYVILVVKSYYLNEKRKLSEYMYWIECVFVILNVFIVFWWIEDMCIFILILECLMIVFF